MAVAVPQDQPFKGNVSPVDVDQILQQLMAVQVFDYQYRQSPTGPVIGPVHIGPFAQPATDPNYTAAGWNQVFANRVPLNPLLIDLGDMVGTTLAGLQGLYNVVQGLGTGSVWQWTGAGSSAAILEPKPSDPNYVSTGTLTFPADAAVAPPTAHYLTFAASNGAMRAGSGNLGASAFGTDSLCVGNNHSVSGTQSTVAGGKSGEVRSNNSAICAGSSNTVYVPAATINNFSGAIVGGGSANSAGAEGACVLTGTGNRATFAHAVVCGGLQNAASNSWAVVGAGQQNTASGRWSGVLSGSTNAASADRSCVVGGSGNRCSGDKSIVCVGTGNTVSSSADSCAVVAGFANNAQGRGTVVVGGAGNTAAGVNSAILCGTNGNLPSDAATSAIVCGVSNSIGGVIGASVVCGRNNLAGGKYAAVLCGEASNALGESSAAIGFSCTAAGLYSVALGCYANAQADLSFVASGAQTVATNAVQGSALLTYPGGVAIRATSQTIEEPECDLRPLAGCFSTNCFLGTDPETRTAEAVVDEEQVLERLLQGVPLYAMYYNSLGTPSANSPLSVAPSATDFYQVMDTDLQYVRFKDTRRIECIDLATTALAAAKAAGSRAAALLVRINQLEAYLRAVGVIVEPYPLP